MLNQPLIVSGNSVYAIICDTVRQVDSTDFFEAKEALEGMLDTLGIRLSSLWRCWVPAPDGRNDDAWLAITTSYL